MSLEFRPVKNGRAVAEWVKALKGKSGVYVIREPGFLGEVLWESVTFPAPRISKQNRDFESSFYGMGKGDGTSPSIKRSIRILEKSSIKPVKMIGLKNHCRLSSDKDTAFHWFFDETNDRGKWFV